MFCQNNAVMREKAQTKFIEGVNGWLSEPLEDCLARASDGSPCIEGKSPVDIEDAIGLYHESTHSRRAGASRDSVQG